MSEPQSNPQPNPRSKLVVNLVMVAIAILVYSVFSRMSSDKTEPISPDQLEALIRQGSVERLNVNPDGFNVRAIFKKEKDPKSGMETQRVIETRVSSAQHLEEFRKLARENNVGFYVDPAVGQSTWFMILNLASNLIIPILIFVFLFRMMSGQAGAAAQFGKNKAKRFEPSADKKTFADVAGCVEAKVELMEVVEFLKDPGSFSDTGARCPRGVMLAGSPGNGKTLLAKAVAGEAGVPFFSISGSDFVEMFVGVGPARVRDLFATAAKNAPCIVFIDEIDAAARKRGASGFGGSHDEREGTLNAILVAMDGFADRSGIIVMAATNRVDILDPALTRPGRFDRQVQIDNPDVIAREEVLKVHAKKIRLGADVNLNAVAKDTPGMSGADLANVINESALLAHRKGKKFVEQSDLSEAVDKESMGAERKSRKLSLSEKAMTAYHEAAHALLATLTPHADPVYKATIIPRGMALGYVKQLPAEELFSRTKQQIIAMLSVLVAGRAAEELMFGPDKVTTGASNDFERATDLLEKMVYRLGMDAEAGLVVYKPKASIFGDSAALDMSDETKRLLEKRVKKLLQESYDQVKSLLKTNKAKLMALAKALYQKETLAGDEIRSIIESTPNFRPELN
ncbi:MAG: ATP-dependent zinc metalloprotease FtsH [bacterium]|nr:ATP-dependent zinc metalloprotease FtsH [bacterium]